jgi:hypothetical protein
MKDWFQRELEAIDPLYFAVYNDKTRKWGIRKWRSKNYKNDWRISSNIVMAVKYPQLDGRTLLDLKRGLWQAKRIKYLMREIDEYNRRNDQKIDAENTEIHRDGAKDIYGHFKTNTVDMGNPNHKVKSVVHY